MSFVEPILVQKEVNNMFINVLSVPRFEMSGNKMQAFLRKDKLKKCLEEALKRKEELKISFIE